MQFLASFFDCFVVVCSLSCYNSKVIFLHKASKQIAFYKQWKEQIMSSKKLIKAIIPVIALILIISTFTGCGKSDQWESGAAKGSEAEKKEANLTDFKAKTLSGKTVTQDMFKDYDMTIVNVWETSCGYCVTEMPGLQQLNSELPDNVQLITICMDGKDETGLAKSITSNAGATFETLIGNSQLEKNLTDKVSVAPTTYFVNNKGKVVGKPHVGAYDTDDPAEIAQKYKDELSVHLLEL